MQQFKPGRHHNKRVPTSAAKSVLRVVNVQKDYNSDGESVRALDHVSLEVAKGEFVSLVGRSGCGKSTLLNLAGAMDFPTAGEVWIDDASTTALDDAGLTHLRRDHVGFVFQSFQLLPTLSVVENVELPLLLAGKTKVREAAMQALEEVEMGAYGKRMPYQLSGGQMQRVAIARALVHKPSLVLADEPTGNLDTATGDLIFALLQRIASTGRVAVLMATHNAEAASLTDRIVRMRDGRVESVEYPARIA
jgi:ABC-type lipoprotein export system ATPase subunit